jgi:hypothetical protein
MANNAPRTPYKKRERFGQSFIATDISCSCGSYGVRSLNEISEFAQMRTRPLLLVIPKQKASVSRKPTRPLIRSLARQMAEVQALREKVRKAEARIVLH